MSEMEEQGEAKTDLTDDELEGIAGGWGDPHKVQSTKSWGDPHKTATTIGTDVSPISSTTIKGDGSV